MRKKNLEVKPFTLMVNVSPNGIHGLGRSRALDRKGETNCDTSLLYAPMRILRRERF